MNDTTLTSKENEALRVCRNMLNEKGRMPSVRELMSAMEYKSPRSASMIFEKLTEKGFLEKRPDGKFQFKESAHGTIDHVDTIDIPLVGTTSCSSPMFAEENIEAYYKISTQIAKRGSQYFFLRISGDSMNLKGINDGDMVLVRQQSTARNGDMVVALIDDEATIKEFQAQNGLVVLKPCSSNPIHKPIIVSEDFRIQGVVIQSLSNL